MNTVRASKALQAKQNNQITQNRKDNSMKKDQNHIDAEARLNFRKTFEYKMGTMAVACALQLGFGDHPAQPCAF